MGIFSKLNKSKHQNLKITTDFHSHILPGIDDGAKDIEQSISMLKAFEEQGYKKIVTTPHIHSTRYPNTKNDLINAYEKLMDALTNENISLEIEFAAEYFVDNQLMKLIQEGEILSTSINKYVLVEYSFQIPPVNVERVYRLLKTNGYTPVLAHPERYEYWYGNIGMFERLKNIGFLFQCNMHSIDGFYGIIQQKNFELLANKAWIDFLGSDAHNTNTVKMIQETMQNPIIQKVIRRGILNNEL
jgi:protein-tyrosine phosphatase